MEFTRSETENNEYARITTSTKDCKLTCKPRKSREGRGASARSSLSNLDLSDLSSGKPRSVLKPSSSGLGMSNYDPTRHRSSGLGMSNYDSSRSRSGDLDTGGFNFSEAPLSNSIFERGSIISQPKGSVQGSIISRPEASSSISSLEKSGHMDEGGGRKTKRKKTKRRKTKRKKTKRRKH
jgi:hypothetical protein